MKTKTTLRLDFLSHEVAEFAWCMKKLSMQFASSNDIGCIASAIRKNVKSLSCVMSNYSGQTKKVFALTPKTLHSICKTPQQLNYLANEALHKMKLRDRAEKRAAIVRSVPVQMEFDF